MKHEQIRCIISEWHERNAKDDWLKIDSQAKDEMSMTRDYGGRIIYELFQNAVDKADKNIWIQFDVQNNRLIFANDGQEFSIEKFPDQPTKELDDFHALCSIHTSNKEGEGLIGYKGVGFKSVWEYANKATIISKISGTAERWGFCLYHPFNDQVVKENWNNPPEVVKNTLTKLGDIPVPSFFFPQYLEQDKLSEVLNEVDANFDKDVSTIVILQIKEDKSPELPDKIKDFRNCQLVFIRLLKAHLNKVVTTETSILNKHSNDDPEFEQTTAFNDWILIQANDLLQQGWDNDLKELAKKIDFEVKKPTVAVAFPPEKIIITDFKPLFYCYLPTDIQCGFNVLIHADFCLDSSRKHIDTDNNAYNKKLIEISAKVLVESILQKQELFNRPDVLQFLIPENCSSGHFIDEVYKLLFEKKRIVSILEKIFKINGHRPLEIYLHNLMLMYLWKNKWQRYSGYVRDYPGARDAIEDKVLSHFRSQDLKLIPLSWNENNQVTIAAPLQTLGVNKKRDSNVGIFCRLKKEAGDEISIRFLEVFEDNTLEGLGIADWSGWKDLSESGLNENFITGDIGTLALRKFVLPEIIRNIQRKLQNKPVSYELREKILKLVIELLLKVERRKKDLEEDVPHCRFFENDKDNKNQLDIDLSDIYLPCDDKKWYPARRTFFSEFDELLKTGKNIHHLDLNHLSKIVKEVSSEIAPKNLATFLGSWETIPLIKKGDALCLPWNDLSGLKFEDKKLFYEEIPKAWELWSKHVSSDTLETVRKQLVEQNWFPLEEERNITTSGQTISPLYVFQVEERDKVKLDFFAKHYVKAGDREFFEAIGIKTIDLAGYDKIIAQLKRMKEFEPSKVSEIRQFKSKYRALVKHLSNIAAEDFHNFDAKDFPLLCERKNEFFWLDDTHETIWFVPQVHKDKKYLFPNFAYAVVDVGTKGDFRKRISLKDFKPETTIEGVKDRKQDENIKRKLAKHLPNLLALADGVRIEGAGIKPESVLERWNRTIFYYCGNVFLKIEIDGEERKEGEGVSDQNVLFQTSKESRKNSPIEIVHDIAKDNFDKNLWRFANTIAEGIFDKVLLNPHFELYFRTCQVANYDLESDIVSQWFRKMHVDDNERKAMEQLIHRSTLTDCEKQIIYDVIHGVFQQNGKPTPENIMETWWVPSTYQGLPLTSQELTGKLPQMKKMGISISPRVNNLEEVRKLARQNSKEIAAVYFLHGDLDKAKQLQSDLEEGKFIDNENNELERFDCRAENVLRCFLEKRDNANQWIWGNSLKLEDWLKKHQADSNKWDDAVFAVENEMICSSAISVKNVKMKNNIIGEARTQVHIYQSTIDDREREYKNKQEKGRKAEDRLAIIESKKILNAFSSKQDRNRCWELIQDEYKRNKYKGKLPDEMPEKEEDLKVWLNPSGDYGSIHPALDGFGYDVMTIEKNDGQIKLVLIEVKNNSIYLSETERLLATGYVKDSKNYDWRLYLYKDGEWHTNSQYMKDALIKLDEELKGKSFPLEIYKWKANFDLK